MKHDLEPPRPSPGRSPWPASGSSRRPAIDAARPADPVLGLCPQRPAAAGRVTAPGDARLQGHADQLHRRHPLRPPARRARHRDPGDPRPAMRQSPRAVPPAALGRIRLRIENVQHIVADGLARQPLETRRRRPAARGRARRPPGRRRRRAAAARATRRGGRPARRAAAPRRAGRRLRPGAGSGRARRAPQQRGEIDAPGRIGLAGDDARPRRRATLPARRIGRRRA